jgi:hypothetical protein
MSYMICIFFYMSYMIFIFFYMSYILTCPTYFKYIYLAILHDKCAKALKSKLFCKRDLYEIFLCGVALFRVDFIVEMKNEESFAPNMCGQCIVSKNQTH